MDFSGLCSSHMKPFMQTLKISFLGGEDGGRGEISLYIFQCQNAAVLKYEFLDKIAYEFAV